MEIIAARTNTEKGIKSMARNSDPHEFEEAVRNYFSGQMGEDIMTAAQQLRQEGMQQEQYLIAKNLLREQINPEVIARATNLSVAAIKRLQEELGPTKH